MEEINKKFIFDFSNPLENTTQWPSFEWLHFRSLFSDSKGRTTFYYTVNSTKESTTQCLSFEYSLIRPGYLAGAVYYVYRVVLTFESLVKY